MIKNCNKLADYIWRELSNYWMDMRDHLLDKSLVTSATLMVFSVTSEGIPEVVIDALKGGNAVTLTYYDHNQDSDVVSSFRTYTYMSFEDIFVCFIDCGSDIDKCIKYLKVVLQHEMGHIIDSMNNEIGKEISLLLDGHRSAYKELERIPKLRRNASIQARLDRIRDVMTIPVEANANAAIGLTIEEILEAERLRLE